MPSTIQYALAIESFLNLSGSAGFLFSPSTCLSYVLLPTSTFPLTTTLSVPPSSETLFQLYAVLVIALTIPILLCIPDTPQAPANRALIFKTLGAGELFIIGLFLTKALDAQRSGFSATGLLMAAGTLLPYLVWRVWALWIDPAVLEVATRGNKKKV